MLLRADLADVDHPSTPSASSTNAPNFVKWSPVPPSRAPGNSLLRPPTDRPASASDPSEMRRSAAVHAQNHRLHAVPRLHHVAGLSHLLRPRHLRDMDHALDTRLQSPQTPQSPSPASPCRAPARPPCTCPATPSQGCGKSCFMPREMRLLRGIDLQHLAPRSAAPPSEHRPACSTRLQEISLMCSRRIHAADIDEGAIVRQAAHRSVTLFRLP